MRHTTGGHRASEYEKIQATDSGGYLNKKLYAVSDLPGIWRRVKEPKVPDTSTVGVLACWFDGGIIFLEPAPTECNELNEGGFANPGDKYTPEAIDLYMILMVSKTGGNAKTEAASDSQEIPGTEQTEKPEPAGTDQPAEADPFDGPANPAETSTADGPPLEM